MSTWIVTGWEETTGKERKLSVDASTEQEARKAAVSQGLLVKDIRGAQPEPASVPPEVPPCPACGARVAPVKRAKASVLAALVLLPVFLSVLAVAFFGLGVVAFVLLLGLLIYGIFFTDYSLKCPNCGADREQHES